MVIRYYALFNQIPSCLRRIFLTKYFRHQDTKARSLILIIIFFLVSWCLCGYFFRFIRVEH
ncbi:hypothetical protein D1AOALGA4SA_11247 [Olavius algarvensis Delta 1 endosymbiont]|nr:hypothetical protein D1AOALGA4SA_11247 [Olavius algarvensis Delta 1 endosymbiont]